MDNKYKIGESYLLSLNIDFATPQPVLKMELFNARERKEINYTCVLTEFSLSQIAEEPAYVTRNNAPVMRLRQRPNRIAINLESIINNININKI